MEPCERNDLCDLRSGHRGACAALATPAVTETDHEWWCDQTCDCGANEYVAPRPDPALAATSDTEEDADRFYTEDSAPVAYMAGTFQSYDASVDRFLASPQAVEELARAMHGWVRSPHANVAWEEYDEEEDGPFDLCVGPDAHRDDAAAILTAWQKVRHPEEA